VHRSGPETVIAEEKKEISVRRSFSLVCSILLDL
jgi:hypothetical protein